MAGICPDCGRKIGFFSKAKRGGQWVCGDCWWKRYQREKLDQAKEGALERAGPVPWGDALPLTEGEEIIEWGAGFCEVFQNPEVLGGVELGDEGFLVLTNRRLAFLAKSGRFSKIYALLYSRPLEEIQQISTGKIGWNDKLIVLEAKEAPEFARVGAHLLAPKINQAILERKREVEEEKRRENIQVVLDFSFLKTYLEKGGLSLQAVKCTNCRAPMKLPENGTTVVCANCGTIHHVQDVFEKVKQLV